MRMALRQLLLSAAQGDTGAVAAELDADPSLLNAQGPHPYWSGEATALHVASEWGRAAIVELLLTRGADPNPDSEDYDGWTPLQTAIHRDHGPAEHDRVVELLIDGGAGITIWAAAALGEIDLVGALSPLVDWLGPNAATPLHFASTVPVAQCLLASGARLGALDKYGRTPAAAVASYGTRHRDCALYLTELAGDMDLARAVSLGEIETVERLYDPAVSVLPAALHGHTAIVEFLLARGADPNAGFPLHQAARNGHIEAARLLIDGGADPSLLDEWYQSTPLDWAEFQGQASMCSFLRNRLS